MDTLDVARVCLRRWYVFGYVLLVAFAASLGLGNERQPVYMSTGNFAVIYRATESPKPDQPDPRELNPLAAGGGSLLKQSIVNDLRSGQSQRALAGPEVKGAGPSDPPDDSRFNVETATNSATVTITAFGLDRNMVHTTVDRVLAAAAGRAKSIQDSVGAPTSGRLTTFVTLPTQTTELPPPSKVKLMIGVMAVGAIAGAALSLLFDQLMTKRKQRRATNGPRPPRRLFGRRPDPHTFVSVASADLDPAEVFEIEDPSALAANVKR